MIKNVGGSCEHKGDSRNGKENKLLLSVGAWLKAAREYEIELKNKKPK